MIAIVENHGNWASVGCCRETYDFTENQMAMRMEMR